jgi:hypothetical protein
MQANDRQWKPEYKTLIGLDANLMDDVDSDEFDRDFKEVNEILKQLNSEVT